MSALQYPKHDQPVKDEIEINLPPLTLSGTPSYLLWVAADDSKAMAQSPAIDRGTDDAYGYDSTSTHPKVIDMGQPDIGYHYYRRVADDDPITASRMCHS